MGYYLGNQNIIDNYRDLAPGRFTNRASLAAGSPGYLAYISDQNDLILGGAVNQSTPDTGVSWYKFYLKPLDYKNEVLLNQGVLAGGGQNVSTYDINTMQQLTYATDALIKLSTGLTFTTAYGGSHSTKLYAYYHQGRDSLSTSYGGYGVYKHLWSNFAITYAISNRPNCQGANINTLQPGPVTQNTYGVVLKGSSSCYIGFATDTWTSGGFNAPNGTGTGWATFTQNYGYNYAGSGDLYRLTFAGAAWAATGTGGPPNGGGSGKVLNTKWGKFYNGGAQIDKYTEATNAWSVAYARNGTIYDYQEQSTMMAQDWGYWCGYSQVSGAVSYYKNTYYQHYATDSLAYMGYANISFPLVAASTATGP
jgi:hypothetical protein